MASRRAAAATAGESRGDFAGSTAFGNSPRAAPHLNRAAGAGAEAGNDWWNGRVARALAALTLGVVTLAAVSHVIPGAPKLVNTKGRSGESSDSAANVFHTERRGSEDLDPIVWSPPPPYAPLELPRYEASVLTSPDTPPTPPGMPDLPRAPPYAPWLPPQAPPDAPPDAPSPPAPPPSPPPPPPPHPFPPNPHAEKPPENVHDAALELLRLDASPSSWKARLQLRNSEFNPQELRAWYDKNLNKWGEVSLDQLFHAQRRFYRGVLEYGYFEARFFYRARARTKSQPGACPCIKFAQNFSHFGLTTPPPAPYGYKNMLSDVAKLLAGENLAPPPPHRPPGPPIPELNPQNVKYINKEDAPLRLKVKWGMALTESEKAAVAKTDAEAKAMLYRDEAAPELNADDFAEGNLNLPSSADIGGTVPVSSPPPLPAEDARDAVLSELYRRQADRERREKGDDFDLAPEKRLAPIGHSDASTGDVGGVAEAMMAAVKGPPQEGIPGGSSYQRASKSNRRAEALSVIERARENSAKWYAQHGQKPQYMGEDPTAVPTAVKKVKKKKQKKHGRRLLQENVEHHTLVAPDIKQMLAMQALKKQAFREAAVVAGETWMNDAGQREGYLPAKTLNVGDNRFEISVMAADEATEEMYTFDIFRLAPAWTAGMSDIKVRCNLATEIRYAGTEGAEGSIFEDELQTNFDVEKRECSNWEFDVLTRRAYERILEDCVNINVTIGDNGIVIADNLIPQQCEAVPNEDGEGTTFGPAYPCRTVTLCNSTLRHTLMGAGLFEYSNNPKLLDFVNDEDRIIYNAVRDYYTGQMNGMDFAAKHKAMNDGGGPLELVAEIPHWVDEVSLEIELPSTPNADDWPDIYQPTVEFRIVDGDLKFINATDAKKHNNDVEDGYVESIRQPGTRCGVNAQRRPLGACQKQSKKKRNKKTVCFDKKEVAKNMCHHGTFHSPNITVTWEPNAPVASEWNPTNYIVDILVTSLDGITHRHYSLTIIKAPPKKTLLPPPSRVCELSVLKAEAYSKDSPVQSPTAVPLAPAFQPYADTYTVAMPSYVWQARPEDEYFGNKRLGKRFVADRVSVSAALPDQDNSTDGMLMLDLMPVFGYKCNSAAANQDLIKLSEHLVDAQTNDEQALHDEAVNAVVGKDVTGEDPLTQEKVQEMNRQQEEISRKAKERAENVDAMMKDENPKERDRLYVKPDSRFGSSVAYSHLFCERDPAVSDEKMEMYMNMREAEEGQAMVGGFHPAFDPFADMQDGPLKRSLNKLPYRLTSLGTMLPAHIEMAVPPGQKALLHFRVRAPAVHDRAIGGIMSPMLQRNYTVTVTRPQSPPSPPSFASPPPPPPHPSFPHAPPPKPSTPPPPPNAPPPSSPAKPDMDAIAAEQNKGASNRTQEMHKLSEDLRSRGKAALANIHNEKNTRHNHYYHKAGFENTTDLLPTNHTADDVTDDGMLRPPSPIKRHPSSKNTGYCSYMVQGEEKQVPCHTLDEGFVHEDEDTTESNTTESKSDELSLDEDGMQILRAPPPTPLQDLSSSLNESLKTSTGETLDSLVDDENTP